MLMNPNPAPPPVNPYDFLNDAPKGKKSLLPSGGSKQQRLIIVIVGLVGLVIAAVIIATVLNSASSTTKADLLKAAQQQQELVRLAALGNQKAKGATAKNLAITTQYTIQSDQAALQAILKKEGVKADTKTLALGKNDKTDQALTAAESANRFDEAFTAALQQELKAYQTTLKNINDASNKKSTKTVIADAYNHAGQLQTIK